MDLTRDAFTALRARWLPDAIFLHLHVSGEEPWAINSRILGVELAGITARQTIATGGFSLMDPANGGLLADLLTYINDPRVQLVSEDGVTAPSWVAAKWPQARPEWCGALRLARLLRLHEPARVPPPLQLEEPGSMVGAALAQTVGEEIALAGDGQGGVYRDAVHVSAMLATQTVHGYAVEPSPATARVPVTVHGRAHPSWSVLSETGHPIITARRPPMVSLSPEARHAFKAPDGQCWVRLRWCQPELRLWAMMSQDPHFARLVRTEDPYRALAVALGPSAQDLRRDELKRDLYTYLHQAAESRFTPRYRSLFPELARFRDAARAASDRGDRVYGWGHRRLPMSHGTPLGFLPLRRLGQHAQATAMNVALTRVFNTAPQDHAISQIVPVFDTVSYVTPTETAEEDSQTAASLFSVPLGLAGDGQPLDMETFVEMGQTWGTVGSAVEMPT